MMVLGVAKLVGMLLAAAGLITAGGEVVGANGHQVFNTTLNLLAVGASAAAAQIIRDLRAKTVDGETPAAVNTDGLSEAVLELRGLALDLREALGKTNA